MIKASFFLCRLGWVLPVALITVGCSAASPSPNQVDTPPLQPIERRSFDPGGPTVITHWTAQGESLPRVVQASGYRSGMRLIDGVSLIFHVQKQRWLLMRDGVPAELEPAQPGERMRLVQPVVDAPVALRASFRQADQDWSVVVTKVHLPAPQSPGIASEIPHSLDLLLLRVAGGP